MFNGELAARAAKLAKEQRERDERLRRQAEKERIAAERQRAREAAREEEARQRRLAALAAEQAEAERRAEETEANRGVYLRTSLAVAPASPDVAAARGIRRAADKLVLPPSVGAELMAQEASRNGAMLFEVAAPSGARTHAGVLEFTAPEGVVLLPPKVVDCLWGPEGEPLQEAEAAGAAAAGLSDGGDICSGTSSSGGGAAAAAASSSGRCAGRVTVSYRLLPKGTYCRLQPARRAFHEAFQDVEDPAGELRHALETALTVYCTLSEGDWVSVQHSGVTHWLRVLELQPAAAVSVIDTDIAADVGPSIETEGYLRARQEAEARERERLRQLAEARERVAAEAIAEADAAKRAEEERAADEAARRLRVRNAAAAGLPPEPPAEGGPGAEPHATCAFRLPDGTRAARRFTLSTPLQVLFDYVDSEGGGGLWPGTYRLVTQFPRRVLLPGGAAGSGSSGTVADWLGEDKQAVLFLELLEDAPQAQPEALAAGAGP